MNLLVVKISALGDVVHALPAALYLRMACPEARLDWLVEETFAPLLEPLPWLDWVIPLNTRKLRREKNLAELLRMGRTLRQIRDVKYDLVFDLQGNCKSGLFTALTGAPRRFGFDRGAVREWPNLLACNRKVALPASCHHVLERGLTLVRAAFPGGETPEFGCCLVPAAEALPPVEAWLAEIPGRRVVCHVGTTWSTKLWAVEHWAELLRFLEGSCTPVLTWGNAGEWQLAAKLCEKSGGKARLWPGGGLRELVALLSRVDLVVGGDTGPIHIAAALGTRTVSLFRATDARRNGPRGARHICLQTPMRCSPCLRRECERDQRCARAITVDAAAAAVEKLLAEVS